MNKNIDGVGEVTAPATPKEKVQNFWYHYKWHSLVALVVIIATLVCSLQFCSREKYDAYVLYAGSKNIGRTTSDGDVAEISKVISAVKRVTGDFDGNGTVSLSFTNYYYLSADEATDATDVNEALAATDKKQLSSVLEHSEYYLLFISKAVYNEYHKVGDEELFIDLTPYAEYNTEAEYYAQNAILLSSLDFYSFPGLSALPEDTLICIRRTSVIGGKSKEHVKYLENAKTMLINILEYNID